MVIARNVGAVLDLMQHVVAANPEIDLLSALLEAKAQIEAHGAHWALHQAAGRPVSQWEHDTPRNLEAKLGLIERAKEFA